MTFEQKKAMYAVLEAVREERRRQHARFGEQDLPFWTPTPRDHELATIAEEALAWEDRRCGKVYGPLGEALKVLRGGQQ